MCEETEVQKKERERREAQQLAEEIKAAVSKATSDIRIRNIERQNGRGIF